MSTRALVVSSVAAFLAAVIVLALDYTSLVRRARASDQLVAEKKAEVAKSPAVADALAHYTKAKGQLLSRIEIINPLKQHQTAPNRQLELLTRIARLRGLVIDDVMLTSHIDMAVHAASPEKLAAARSAIEAMQLDSIETTYRPRFTNAPGDRRWVIELEEVRP